MNNTAISHLEKYLGVVLCAIFIAIRKLGLLFGNNNVDSPTKKIVFVKFIEQGALVLHQNTFKQAALQYGAENIYICTFESNAQLVDILEAIPTTNKILINEKNLWQFTKGFVLAFLKIRKLKIDTGH